ncbi:hypothetical protein [Jeongeupia chitinilytica]|uniref:Lipoprotein n=1 Tax=Jeongeupia chitinilytica TaxID=1041641 RepID=A0ABQ3GWE6_9NEIS|nr:hypothetical protein [Jeongeupia chitinilytica]GHD56807.1 hypothetical protein GCM10007350_04550 [Jeongeupia chitinilytica]
MKTLLKTLAGIAGAAILLSLTGCAHPIVITPEKQAAQAGADKPAKIDKTVAYYISAEDRNREVVTPGGGGDQVRYQPYRDLEVAYYMTLADRYNKVVSLTTPDDAKVLDEKQVSYIFKPTLTTDSSSDSMLTWPPTRFSVKLDTTAIDRSGKSVWVNQVTGQGEAEFDEFKHNFNLSAQRASTDAMRKFSQQLTDEAVPQ